jgi:hypothetical protein
MLWFTKSTFTFASEIILMQVNQLHHHHHHICSQAKG